MISILKSILHHSHINKTQQINFILSKKELQLTKSKMKNLTRNKQHLLHLSQQRQHKHFFVSEQIIARFGHKKVKKMMSLIKMSINF